MNPAASNLDEELRRFDYKVEAGAEFAITQPVFDLAASNASSSGSSRRGFRSSRDLPLESLRHAEFMANEVPGSSARARDRADAAGRRTARRAAAEGVAIAREVAPGFAAGAGDPDLDAAGAIESALGV